MIFEEKSHFKNLETDYQNSILEWQIKNLKICQWKGADSKKESFQGETHWSHRKSEFSCHHVRYVQRKENKIIITCRIKEREEREKGERWEEGRSKCKDRMKIVCCGGPKRDQRSRGGRRDVKEEEEEEVAAVANGKRRGKGEPLGTGVHAARALVHRHVRCVQSRHVEYPHFRSTCRTPTHVLGAWYRSQYHPYTVGARNRPPPWGLAMVRFMVLQWRPLAPKTRKHYVLRGWNVLLEVQSVPIGSSLLVNLFAASSNWWCYDVGIRYRIEFCIIDKIWRSLTNLYHSFLRVSMS